MKTKEINMTSATMLLSGPVLYCLLFKCRVGLDCTAYRMDQNDVRLNTKYKRHAGTLGLLHDEAM